jgi:hypothetical protein
MGRRSFFVSAETEMSGVAGIHTEPAPDECHPDVIPMSVNARIRLSGIDSFAGNAGFLVSGKTTRSQKIRDCLPTVGR